MISVIVATCFVAFITSAILCLLCYEAMLNHSVQERATGLEKGGIYRHLGASKSLRQTPSTTLGKSQGIRASKAQSRFRIRLTASNKWCGTLGNGEQGWCREAARC
jgi:hypothetical protein